MTTLSNAREAAIKLDLQQTSSLKHYTIPTKKVVSRLRAYMLRRAEENQIANDVFGNFKTSEETPGIVVINYGPSMDSGPTAQHFLFDDGARLSFGITLRETNSGSEILAYRFHLHFPDGSSPQFIRMDLNRESHSDPLFEPRCHLHPGIENARVPIASLTPLEVLDRMFFVIEPSA